MCDCKSEIEQKLVEKHKDKLVDVKAELQGYALLLGEKITQAPYMEAAISHTITVKKTGVTKRKGESVNIMFSYCPFCGEKLQK